MERAHSFPKDALAGILFPAKGALIISTSLADVLDHPLAIMSRVVSDFFFTESPSLGCTISKRWV